MRSGVVTSRTETASPSRRMSCIATRFATSACTSPITCSSGSRRSRKARASGRAAASSCVSRPTSFAEPPARSLGEGEQPQRLAGGRAVDDDHVPVAVLDVLLEPQQAEQLVSAGRDGELLGGDPFHAALDQHLAEPALDLGPVALELLLRGDLLRPQVRARLGGLRPDGLLEHVGERVRRIGGQDARCGGRRRRSGARWPPRPTSCRRRPCLCRGWCAGPSKARQPIPAACASASEP